MFGRTDAPPAPPAGPATSRRGFLKLTLGAGAGLVLGVPSLRAETAPAATGAGTFNPFVRVDADGTVTVIVKHLDKGQGSATGLATLVAEEIGATPAQVAVEFAPADTELYKNLAFGIQGTGGSTAMANSFVQYRSAGAAARVMLAEAAAQAWGVPAAEVTVVDGVIAHAGAGRSAGLGEFAEAARAVAVPAEPPLRAPAEWRYIGKSFPRVEIPEKSRGSVGLFGMDLQLDGMVVAVVARPPKWGATVKSLDDAAARAVKGVVDVVTVPQGVAVIAESTWPAIKGRKALVIEWDESVAETRSSADLLAEYTALADQPGTVAHTHGDAEAELAKAAHVVERTFEFPYLAHAPMEPLDVTVRYDGASAELWAGFQMQTVDQGTAAGVLGLPPEKVTLHTLWAGGSFGRRAIADAHYVAEAAAIAKAWNRPAPVKVVWTREDDIRGGYYRPMYVHKVRAGVDAAGRLVGWHHRIVGQSLLTGTPFEQFMVKDGVDETSVEGVHDMPYRADGFHVEVHNTKVGVPVLWWRSVGHTHTAYAVETVMDELAALAGKDPVEFRLGLLADDPRRAGVLKLAAEKAGWGKPVADGLHRGVAVHRSFGTWVAEVADVRVAGNGRVKVERVVAAVDCGVPINPDNIRAQVEGGIGYGLGAILRNEVTLTGGAVDQANFDTYLPLRLTDMPVVETHIVASSEAPSGIGEPAVPPIGPAVANAIAAATGQRVTTLPMSRHGLA